MSMKKLKAQSQALYFQRRENGLDHATAMAAVVHFVVQEMYKAGQPKRVRHYTKQDVESILRGEDVTFTWDQD